MTRFPYIFLVALLSVAFLETAEAETFFISQSLSKDSVQNVYRDQLIEKDLEMVYLGLMENPDPSSADGVRSEYRFRLAMKNWLGATLAEKNISVFEGPLVQKDIDLAVYDDKSGKWQEFRDLELVVKPDTTGIVANITVAGAGRFIDPKIEPFATGAQQLDPALNIKIISEYLPPNKDMTITSSILKKRSSTGEVTNLGNFSFSGTTDAAGKLTVERWVNINEPFDNRNNDTYSLTASASYYFTFKDSAVTETRSAHTDFVKNITISDFELKNVASEFFVNRAYFTWNDKIVAVPASRLESVEKNKSSAEVRYGGNAKTYSDIPELVVSLRDIAEKTISFVAGIDTFTIARESALEVILVSPAMAEINGVKKSDLVLSARMFASGGTPKVSLKDASGRTVVEESGRDLRLVFETANPITHEVSINPGGAVSLSFGQQKTGANLVWNAQLESSRRPGLLRQFKLSGQAVLNGAVVEPAPPTDIKEVIASLQKQLIVLLQKLLALLIIK